MSGAVVWIGFGIAVVALLVGMLGGESYVTNLAYYSNNTSVINSSFWINDSGTLTNDPDLSVAINGTGHFYSYDPMIIECDTPTCLTVYGNYYVDGTFVSQGGGTFGGPVSFSSFVEASSYISSDSNIFTPYGNIYASIGDLYATQGDIYANQGDVIAMNGNVLASQGDINASNGEVCSNGVCISDKQNRVTGTCESGFMTGVQLGGGVDCSSATNRYATGITVTETGDIQNITITGTGGFPTIWASFIDNNSGSSAEPQNLSYEPSTDTLSITNGNNVDLSELDTTLSDEEVEDITGDMVTGNTETGITVTYQDSDGTLDFVVSATGGSPSTEQFEGETARNFIKNACFYTGTDTDDGVPGWTYTDASDYDLVDATVGTGHTMSITEDVDDSTYHYSTNPYLWFPVNNSNFSNIDEDGDLSNRWVRLEGNINSYNANITYQIDSYKETQIKVFAPDGYVVPGYFRTTYWGGNITTGELLEVVDPANRCSKAIKLLNTTNAIYSEWITVPNGVPFLVDIEFNAPEWINRSGYGWAKGTVQVEAADLDENIIYRFNSRAGPDYTNTITSEEGAGYDYYGTIGTEGWRRMQFQLPDMSDPDNWIAVATSQGSESIAKVGSAIKVRIRLLNQYSYNDAYFTGAQLLQGTSAKAFNLHTFGEDDAPTGYTPVGYSFAKLNDDSTASVDLFSFGTGSAETDIGSDIVWDGTSNIFTISSEGVYEVHANILAQCSSSNSFTLGVYNNDVLQTSMLPWCHSSVDPVGRSIVWIDEFNEGDEINVTVDATSTNSITLKTGSSVTIKRLG